MLETAVEACPVQIFLILDDLYSENWFIELVAFLVHATSTDYPRPVVVHLVQESFATILGEKFKTYFNSVISRFLLGSTRTVNNSSDLTLKFQL